MSAIKPRKKESGAQGRKRRKKEKERLAKLARSLDSFLVNTAESTPGSSRPPQEPDRVSMDISVVALEAETALHEDASTSVQPNILPENIDPKVFTDIGYWPKMVDETLKTELVKRGTVELQNKDALFPKDSKGRSFSKDWFYMALDSEYYTSTCAMSAIKPRKKESGAQGRKRRKKEKERLAKLARSFDRFLVNTAESTPGSSRPPQEPDRVSVDISVVALEAETALHEDASTSVQPNILPENIDPKVFTDIGYWPKTVDETLKTELVKRGTVELQNKDALFPKDSKGRSFSKDWFYMALDSGEMMLRTWLVFSPVNCAAYCFPCMLFMKAKGKSSFGKASGFNAWKNLSPRILEHERSPHHLSAFTMWKEFEMRLQKRKTIDKFVQIKSW